MSDAGTYEGGVETSLVATRGRWKGEFPPQGEHDDTYHNL
jgi:hypothetical protein